MALILHLSPAIEDSLRSEAQRLGLSVEEYVRSLVERQVAPPPKQPLTLDEFEAELDGLAEYSDKIPDLPPEALTRAGIYDDHD